MISDQQKVTSFKRVGGIDSQWCYILSRWLWAPLFVRHIVPDYWMFVLLWEVTVLVRLQDYCQKYIQ